MKWYGKYMVVWAIVFLVVFLFFTSEADDMMVRIIISLIFGTIISSVGYLAYESAVKEDKMKGLSEEEKAKVKEEERKKNRFWIWVMVAIAIFWVILIAVAMLVGMSAG